MAPQPNNQPDVIIIGGGPAGLSAALWCSDLGMSSIILEKEAELGGQLLRIFNPIKNYIGRSAENGREMQGYFLRSINNAGLLERKQADVTEIDVTGKSMILNNRERISAKAIIIATGVRRRKLGVEGEALFRGKGIIESGSKEKNDLRGKRVLIVGGGDGAIENALILAEYASEIHVVHRSSTLRTRDEFVERAKRHPRIEIRADTIVNRFSGDPVRTASDSDRVPAHVRTASDSDRVLKSVEITNPQTGEINVLPIDAALVRIGVEPNTELLKGKLKLDDRGYILVDHNCETSAPGIFAAGDAANHIAPTINTAVGMGSTAAKAIYACIYPKKAVL